MELGSVARSRVLGGEFDQAIQGTVVNGFGRRVVLYDEAAVVGIVVAKVRDEIGEDVGWPLGLLKVSFRADWARERVGEFAPVVW